MLLNESCDTTVSAHKSQVKTARKGSYQIYHQTEMVTMKVDDLQALEPLKVKSYSEVPSKLNYVSDFSYCTR